MAGKQLLAARHLPHTRLGHAMQLGTPRLLGTFLVDPPQAPPVVVQALTSQLGLAPEQASAVLGPAQHQPRAAAP